MEASQTPAGGTGQGSEEAQGPDTQGGAPPAAEEAREAATPEPVAEEEANPARDQAPVATDAQDTIVGDPGLRGEQQPQQNEGASGSANTPVRTSPPPPSAQSGVPLPEDRAAGVEPGPAGPLGPGGVPMPQQGAPTPPVPPQTPEESGEAEEEREGGHKIAGPEGAQ